MAASRTAKRKPAAVTAAQTPDQNPNLLVRRLADPAWPLTPCSIVPSGCIAATVAISGSSADRSCARLLGDNQLWAGTPEIPGAVGPSALPALGQDPLA